MEFIFDCPHCRRQLAGQDSARGQTVSCPACQQPLVVPTPPPPVSPKVMAQPEAVEVVEEFEVSPGTPPPLAPRQPSALLPAASRMPSETRRPLQAGPASATAYLPRQPEPLQLHRHRYQPVRHQTRAVVTAVVVVFCLALATVIFVIGKAPGDTMNIAPTAHRKAPIPTKASLQFDATRLTNEEKQDLARLTEQAFGNLTEDKRQAAVLIYGKMNQKKPITEEELAVFRASFREGVLKLSAEDQQRIVQLFAKTASAGQ